MKKSNIKKLFALSLSFSLLAGCGTSASGGNSTQGKKASGNETASSKEATSGNETASQSVTPPQQKTADPAEVQKAKDQITTAQGLIQQSKYDEAQQILQNLLDTNNGKTNMAQVNDQAAVLLNQVNDQMKKQNQNAAAIQKPTATTNPAPAATTNASSTGFQYETYKNNRFGFSVQYPNIFTVGPQPTNDDGRQFYNGESKIIAAASRVLDSQAVQTEYQQAIANATGPISYKTTGSNWFVVSYKDGANIVYEKSIIQDGMSFDLSIEYPSSQQAKYGPMVTHIVDTFVPGHSD